MNAYNPPVRIPNPFEDIERQLEEQHEEARARPIGHDAPKHSLGRQHPHQQPQNSFGLLRHIRSRSSRLRNRRARGVRPIRKDRMMAKKIIQERDGWLWDSRGNRNEIARYGSREAAEKALLSLKNCDNCINCSRCWDCSDCSRCSGCSDCSRCLRCLRCSGCSRCSDCSRCWYCSGLRNQTGVVTAPADALSADAPVLPPATTTGV